MYNSGNADQDALTFGQNLQNQQYDEFELQKNLQADRADRRGYECDAAGSGTRPGGGLWFARQFATSMALSQGSIANNVAWAPCADNNMVAVGQAAGAKNLLGAGLSLRHWRWPR